MVWTYEHISPSNKKVNIMSRFCFIVHIDPPQINNEKNKFKWPPKTKFIITYEHVFPSNKNVNIYTFIIWLTFYQYYLLYQYHFQESCFLKLLFEQSLIKYTVRWTMVVCVYAVRVLWSLHLNNFAPPQKLLLTDELGIDKKS